MSSQGAELNELSDEEFQKVFKQYSVYARVSPEHKVRIVKAWQKEGKVVAMTGMGSTMHHHLRQLISVSVWGLQVQRFLRELLIWSLPMTTSPPLS